MQKSQSAPDTREIKETSRSAARRGRPVGDHQSKRAELLRAAISVIAEEGYAGASMRKVAKRAGYTTGAVTYYFANKEEMVTAAAETLFNQFDDLLEATGQSFDIKALIQEWLNWANINDADTWLAMFQLLAHARHEPAFASIVRQRYGQFRQNLALILAKGQGKGVIRDDIRADILADQISAMSDGWMMLMPIEPERFEPKRGQALLDAVITLISPPGR